MAAAGPDDTYLARLRTLGFTWPPDHDAALTAMGRLGPLDVLPQPEVLDGPLLSEARSAPAAVRNTF